MLNIQFRIKESSKNDNNINLDDISINIITSISLNIIINIPIKIIELLIQINYLSS